MEKRGSLLLCKGWEVTRIGNGRRMIYKQFLMGWKAKDFKGGAPQEVLTPKFKWQSGALRQSEKLMRLVSNGLIFASYCRRRPVDNSDR